MANAGQDDEDQPLENYLKRMKEHMAERLHHMHTEQLATAASGYEEKLGVADLARGEAEARAAEAVAALARTRKEAMAQSASAAEETQRLTSELQHARAAEEDAQAELEELRRARDEALKARAEAEGRAKRLESDALHDTDDLESPAANLSVAGLRKAELLKLKAELAEEQRRTKAVGEQAAELSRDLSDAETAKHKMAEDLSSERKRAEGLVEDNSALREQNRFLMGKNGALEEKASAAMARATAASANASAAAADRDSKGAQLVETQMTLKQVVEDLRKMRGRFEDRDAYATQAEIDLGEARARIKELEAELAKRSQQLSAAKEAVVREQASRGEAESGATWLATELARYKAMLDARAADAEGLRQQAAHGDAEANRLRKIIESHGFSGAEAAVTLESDMEKVRRTAGVYDSIGILPKVPGLEQLASALATAETETLDVTTKLRNMHKVDRVDFTNLVEGPAEADDALADTEDALGDTSRSLTPLQ